MQEKRILIVDDDKNLAMITQDMLTDYGYAVTCVLDSETAFEELKNSIVKTVFLNPLNVIYIKDNGQGIVPEDMPFIFEKFYRGKNVNEQSGSGLGLYIAKYIMDKMEGSISLHNHKDGLEVKLELPLAELS